MNLIERLYLDPKGMQNDGLYGHYHGLRLLSYILLGFRYWEIMLNSRRPPSAFRVVHRSTEDIRSALWKYVRKELRVVMFRGNGRGEGPNKSFSPALNRCPKCIF